MNRLFRLFNRQKSPQGIQAPRFLRVGVTPYDAPAPYNAVRQETLYGVLSWIQTAVRILAQTAAGSPFQVSEWEGEKKIGIENHPFELLLRAPNPLQSRFEFLEATIGFRELTGNAYVWLNRAGADKPPSELWILPSDKMRPVPDARMYLRGYEYTPPSGSPILLDTWEICHLKRFNPTNDFIGLSALESLIIVARGDIAMQKWNTNYFAHDHAKPPGALAFSDRINDSDWETMKHDLDKEHGGTQRRMMRLRGAGKGGVQWLNFGVSQKDMEFLEARTFNKEEIFGTLAPGLASMLSVNATEANSKTGKQTFMEMAVWPIHQAVGEKFTSEVLPSYGENLVGEFDDVRVVNHVIRLQEQQASYNVLTVAEVRDKYYGLGPLGDGRDQALVNGGDVPTVTEVSAPVTEPAQDATGAVTKSADERALQDAERRLGVLQAAISAGVDMPQAIELSGLKIDALPTLPIAKSQKEIKASFGPPEGYVILSLNNIEDILRQQQMVMRSFPDGTVIRLTPAEELHITLAYCLMVDEKPFADIARETGRLFTRPFDIRGQIVTTFPSENAIPIIMLVEAGEELKQFQAALAARFTSRQLEISEYSKPEQWTPHITLGYIDADAIKPDWQYPTLFNATGDVVTFSRGDFENIETFAVKNQGRNDFRADLLQWQRKITKRAKADRPIGHVTFESDTIPGALRAAIEGALSEVKAITDIRGVFDDALTWEPYS